MEISQVWINTLYVTPWGTTRGAGDLTRVILQNGLAVAGILFLFLLVGGGVGLIASAGKGDAQGSAKAKAAVTAAVAGFVIIFISYWILQALGYFLWGNANYFTSPTGP
jgi:Zn-dependent protease with chaperone function